MKNLQLFHIPSGYDYSKNKLKKPPKAQMIKSLKSLVDLLGFIPPRNFLTDLSYLKGLTKEELDKAIIILNKMPPYHGENYIYDYREVFGSWFKALTEAGVLD